MLGPKLNKPQGECEEVLPATTEDLVNYLISGTTFCVEDKGQKLIEDWVEELGRKSEEIIDKFAEVYEVAYKGHDKDWFRKHLRSNYHIPTGKIVEALEKTFPGALIEENYDKLLTVALYQVNLDLVYELTGAFEWGKQKLLH